MFNIHLRKQAHQIEIDIGVFDDLQLPQEVPNFANKSRRRRLAAHRITFIELKHY